MRIRRAGKNPTRQSLLRRGSTPRRVQPVHAARREDHDHSERLLPDRESPARSLRPRPLGRRRTAERVTRKGSQEKKDGGGTNEDNEQARRSRKSVVARGARIRGLGTRVAFGARSSWSRAKKKGLPRTAERHASASSSGRPPTMRPRRRDDLRAERRTPWGRWRPVRSSATVTATASAADLAGAVLPLTGELDAIAPKERRTTTHDLGSSAVPKGRDAGADVGSAPLRGGSGCSTSRCLSSQPRGRSKRPASD